ncbi:MAG: flagellar export protein FliJ [Oscillospiraceae bacterium]|nr:flagellar export protein FliJ [Oscillospiraceae bacterium]
MKRFQFQLQSVLDYKQRTLDELMVQLDRAQSRMAEQERKRDDARQRLTAYDAEFAEKRAEGFTNVEALEYEAGQRVLEQRLRREQAVLEQRRREFEAKREEVIEARQETRAIEKLKEIRRGEYDEALRKADEKMLDDLTAARRAQAAG